MPTKKKVSKKKVATKKTATKIKNKATRKTAQKSSKKTATKKVQKCSGCTCTNTCAPAESFWVNNGPVVDSLASLKQALKTMSDEQFKYHTARDGNDFARWIEACLSDRKSAANIQKAKTRSGAARALSGVCSCK